MQNCNLRYELGKPIDDQPAQWLEGEFRISRGRFHIEANICTGWAEEAYSQHTVALDVEQPFSAEACLDLLELLCRPPFEPTYRDLRLDCSGDAAIANGEIARLVDPELMSASIGLDLPARASKKVEEQLLRIDRARTIESWVLMCSARLGVGLKD